MNEIRLINANDLEIELTKQKAHLMDKSKHTTIESDRMMYVNTATGLIHAINILHEAPTVEPDAIKELGSETLAIIKDILPQIVEQSARIVRPSADWIEFKYGLYYCSNCFDKVDKDIDRIEHLVAKRDLSPFCPFCGSLMKGKGKAYD